MSSTSKITSRGAGAGAGAGAIAGAVPAWSCRRWSVTCSGKIESPLLLIAVAKEDRERVHQQQDDHHHQDGSRRKVDELTIRVLGPCEDLNRERRERRAEPLGVEARVDCGADHQ